MFCLHNFLIAFFQECYCFVHFSCAVHVNSLFPFTILFYFEYSCSFSLTCWLVSVHQIELFHLWSWCWPFRQFIQPAQIQILKGRTGSCKAWELAAKQSVSARPIEWRVKQWTMRVVWNEERIDKKGRWGSEARGADDEGQLYFSTKTECISPHLTSIFHAWYVIRDACRYVQLNEWNNERWWPFGWMRKGWAEWEDVCRIVAVVKEWTNREGVGGRWDEGKGF